jgi:TPP-dependent pyruvate/acetoin dehydrogenase alpha subunit
MKIGNDLMKDLYKTMIKIRRFEEATAKYYAAGLIPGFVHLYIGEEAIATGACAAIQSNDFITSTHRGHGHLIAKGGDLKLMMAELFAKRTGYCKGKGGSMHICDMSLGIIGSNGIVGAGLSIAVGVGYGAKVFGKGQVCLCFFGDGASNRGTFHESINLASTWNLPIVYICENNLYGISGCARDTMNICDISERSKSYGIPGYSIDGNDIMAVYNTTIEAVDNAREGKGPSLIECKTWRHHGHWEGDLDQYRDKKEHSSWLLKDPIINFANKLIKEKVADQNHIDRVDDEIKTEVEKAIEFAKSSPYPDPEELYADVYK